MQSLCNLEYRSSASESPWIRQTIEEVIRSIVWIMASLTGIGNNRDCMTLQESLLQEMEERKELFFLLLSLLYESQTIQHIRESIESQDQKARVYALEICDMTVSEEIKDLFFPLFEDITIHEKLQRFRYRFPQEKLTFGDRIRSIVQQKPAWVNPWTRACALDILGRLNDPDGMDTERILAANMLHPEKVVREVADRALKLKNLGYYQKTLQIYCRHMPYDPPPGDRLIFDLQKQIKEIPWLTPVSDHLLLPLATTLQHCPGEIIPDEVILDFITGNPMLTGRYLDHIMNEKS